MCIRDRLRTGVSKERLAKLFGARPSVIHTDKPSLSVCAFGAGAAHAAVLALILPVMVTLPAPEDRAQGTVAIEVAVRSAPPSPFIEASAAGPAMLEGAPEGEGEGDADDAAWNELPPEEITGALPDIPEQAPLNEAPAALMEQAALSDPVAPTCLLYTSPSPRDRTRSRMPSS